MKMFRLQNGKYEDLDDDDVARDGEWMHVRMMLMDNKQREDSAMTHDEIVAATKAAMARDT